MSNKTRQGTTEQAAVIKAKILGLRGFADSTYVRQTLNGLAKQLHELTREVLVRNQFVVVSQ